MNKSQKHKTSLVIGVLLSVLCLYWAFSKVDFGEMWQAVKTVNYVYMVPVVAVIFFSHFLRAFRWRYLLDPIRRLDIKNLFSSLIIGYAANLFMPAHLGEFLRAYVLSKKRQIPMSPVFATILVERIIDVFSLLVLMLLALFIYPFPNPDLVIEGAYIMLAGTIGLLVFLIFLKRATSQTIRFIGIILKPFPDTFEQKTRTTLEKLAEGISPLKQWHDYITVGILSLFIWACYGFVFFFCLHAFDFVETYQLDWSVSLILLVITTIAVVVPSSPGYVGTYHWLCQITLSMFAVPKSPALSFAIVVHGVNFFPVFIAGLFFAHLEGMAVLKMSEDAAEIEIAARPEGI
jgi:glycosyltransferase 2 family protein